MIYWRSVLCHATKVFYVYLKIRPASAVLNEDCKLSHLSMKNHNVENCRKVVEYRRKAAVLSGLQYRGTRLQGNQNWTVIWQYLQVKGKLSLTTR